MPNLTDIRWGDAGDVTGSVSNTSPFTKSTGQFIKILDEWPRVYQLIIAYQAQGLNVGDTVLVTPRGNVGVGSGQIAIPFTFNSFPLTGAVAVFTIPIQTLQMTFDVSVTSTLLAHNFRMQLFAGAAPFTPNLYDVKGER